MCPPVNGSREEVCPGRHMGRPLQIQLKPPSTPGGAGGDRAPPLPSYQGAKQRADVGIGPYGTKGRPHRPPWPVAQGGASAPAVARGGWDMQQRASPKCPATSGNPSVALRATAPFAQGSLALWGTGERADTRVRPYVVIGIASSARRGGTEPAPYGSTGSAGLRADVPKAWPPPTKFRSEIWGVGHRHWPLRKDGERISASPAGPQLPIPRDSGMVSKGRAAALPLVVSRRGWEGNRNPSRNFSWGSPLDRQRAPARWPHRARRARHFPASRRGRGLPGVQRKPKPLFPAKTPGNRLTGVFGCGII